MTPLEQSVTLQFLPTKHLKLNTGYPKEVPCGMIMHTLDMAEELAKNGKQFTLSFNGKMLAQGCFGEHNGDIDLWGHEGCITLHQAIRQRDKLIISVDDLKNTLTKKTVHNMRLQLQSMTCKISKEIKKLHAKVRSEFFARQRLFKLVENNPDRSPGLRCALSLANANTADCENIIWCAVDLNHELCKEITNTHGSMNVFSPSQHVVLSQQPNCLNLMPPEERNTTLDYNPLSVKQRLKKWFAIQSKTKMTGSTVGKAVGLQGLAEQKRHHAINVLNKPALDVPAEVKVKMDHGTNFDKHALPTLCGEIMPALLPPCYAYFEVGTKVMDGPKNSNLITVSPDGILQCTMGERKCKFYKKHHHRRIMVEFKAPYPNDDLPLEPYYKIPARHVPQVLCQLACFDAEELWLICCTTKTVTVIVVY